MQNLISFLIGAFIATLITTLIFLKKQTSEKEELIRLRAESKNYNSLEELIKQDFVRLANETIKQEQEDFIRQIHIQSKTLIIMQKSINFLVDVFLKTILIVNLL